MATFPFYVELDNMPGLIVGGGIVALRKIEKLNAYGPRLTVVARELCGEIREIPGLILKEREFAFEDLEGCEFVIAATDDVSLNREISRACRERRIPVNVVDDPEACTFLFPALYKKGRLSVGVSTGGASPLAAAWIRDRLAEILPERIDEILDQLESLRAPAKREIPRQADRAAFLKDCLTLSLAKGAPLSEEDLRHAWNRKERP